MTSKRFVRVLALVGVLCLCDLASASRIAYSVTNLGLVWGESASANRINRTGDVVGFLWTASEGPHGFLWNRVNGMRDLGTFGGKESTAFGLNDLGDVAGQWVAADGKQYAFLWNATDGMRSLGTIGGTGERSHAWAVNDSRQVVGWCILQGWQAYDPY
ncbi:MAG: hypothetical protein NTU83_14560, partial [Candidatus Hydrogenedentes bacterium]|nr:hypothetical protein [Candidatus Hydrogenedentota bacterium]